MLVKALDQLYNAYAIVLLAGIVCLDVLHFPVWPKSWVLPFSHGLEQHYIRKYNDPLSAGLPSPNGWQSGMYFFEQLYIPFLFYQLFAKSGIKKELGGLVVGTELTVVCSLCLWEIWAFDDAIVSRAQKMTLNWMYGPFLFVAVVWVLDMLVRIHRRVATAERLLKRE